MIFIVFLRTFLRCTAAKRCGKSATTILSHEMRLVKTTFAHKAKSG